MKIVSAVLASLALTMSSVGFGADGFFAPRQDTAQQEPRQDDPGSSGAKFKKDVHGRVTRIDGREGRFADITYDHLGRPATLTLRQGTAHFIYDGPEQQEPKKAIVNGKMESLPLKPRTEHPPEKGGAKGAKFEIYDDMFGGGWDLSCDIFSGYNGVTWGDLNTALGIGGALGAVTGAVTFELYGGMAETVAIAAQLGGVAGFGVVLAAVGGWNLGSVIYDRFGCYFWKEKYYP